MEKKITLTESDIIRMVGKVVKEHESGENITEQLSSGDDNTFTTVFDSTSDIDFLGIEHLVPELEGSSVNYDFESIQATVKWRYELELRSWGIKDIYVYTDSVDIEGVVSIWGEEEGDTLKEFSISVDTMAGFSDDRGWVYQDEQNSMEFGTILPRNIMIDAMEQLVTVEW